MDALITFYVFILRASLFLSLSLTHTHKHTQSDLTEEQNLTLDDTRKKVLR